MPPMAMMAELATWGRFLLKSSSAGSDMSVPKMPRRSQMSVIFWVEPAALRSRKSCCSSIPATEAGMRSRLRFDMRRS
jgi:hypothetical protein